MRKFDVNIIALALALQIISPNAHGQSAPPANAYPAMAPLNQYLIPDEKSEVALARTAAPSSISDTAEVMVLGHDGYKVAVKGTNGFLCIVERSWGQGTDQAEFWNPKMRAPHCFNAQAARSFAQIYLLKTKLVLAGKSKAEIAQAIKSALDKKEIPPLEPGAMAYMMSRQQYLNDHDKAWHSHAMFFSSGDMTKNWAADDPNSPVMTANDPEERVTILFVMADKWSDGSPASAKMPKSLRKLVTNAATNKRSTAAPPAETPNCLTEGDKISTSPALFPNP